MSPSNAFSFAPSSAGSLATADLVAFIVCLLATALLGWMIFGRRMGRG